MFEFSKKFNYNTKREGQWNMWPKIETESRPQHMFNESHAESI